jgi:Flp pilus assembly protein TadD
VSAPEPDAGGDQPVREAGAVSSEGAPRTASDAENNPPEAEIKAQVFQQRILPSTATIEPENKGVQGIPVSEEAPVPPASKEPLSAAKTPSEPVALSQPDQNPARPAKPERMPEKAASVDFSGNPPPGKKARAVVAPAERFYQKAVSYHRQNRLPEAISLYLAVLKENPGHTPARFNLAAAYIQTAAYPEAFTLLESLSALDPANPEIVLNMAISKIGSGDLQQALMLLNSAEEKHAPAFELCFHRGVIFSRSGQPEEALRWYQQAEGINPQADRLIFNMALIHDKLRHYEAALRYYLLFLDQPASSLPDEKEAVADRVRVLRSYLGRSHNT